MSLYRWICVEFSRRKKKILNDMKKLMTRKQLHIVCLSFHCVFLATLNTFRDMCAAAFFKFIAWSTQVAMEISGLSVLVGAIGQTRKKPCSRNHHIQTHSIRIFKNSSLHVRQKSPIIAPLKCACLPLSTADRVLANNSVNSFKSFNVC